MKHGFLTNWSYLIGNPINYVVLLCFDFYFSLEQFVVPLTNESESSFCWVITWKVHSIYALIWNKEKYNWVQMIEYAI